MSDTATRTAPRDGLSWKIILIPTALCLAVLLVLLFLPLLFGYPANSPYPADEPGQNIAYKNFDEVPKNLDPAISYWTDEGAFLGSILEPPYQYDYLKRPQEMIPNSVVNIPHPVYFDKDGKQLAADAPDEEVARVQYDFEVRKGLMYAPHPCFAQENGKYLYHNLAADDISLDGIDDLNDPFFKTGTREATADDFVNQIRRMGDPRLEQPCPLADRWCELIEGFEEYMEAAKAGFEAEEKRQAALPNGIHPKSKYHRVLIPLDLTAFPLHGVELLDRYHFRITLKKKYPQLLYWMALNFFAPTPHEAEIFYYQEPCIAQALSFKRFPVGTGPFYISKYDPASEIRLDRNPNFLQWQEYPSVGEEEDAAAGRLADAGKKLPFTDRIRYLHESESLPIWNKFLQGYYDVSGISKDSFDKAIKIDQNGFNLAPEMADRGIKLVRAQDPAIYYYCFNMRDPVVGQVDEKTEPDADKRAELNEKHRKLRLAISIAMDFNEYIQIFLNGRGIVANGPLPPGMFGYRKGKEGVNPYTEVWDQEHQVAKRKSIEEAKKLLAEAGYPNGVDPATGHPLTLSYDNTATSAADQPIILWYHKQFEKLGIYLQSNSTDGAVYDEKMRKGTAQMFTMGWFADYPDPENFLFLLITKEAVVDSGGENRANYTNPKFDELFHKMKAMDSGPERQKIIDDMVDLVRHDSPWNFNYHPQSFALVHSWISNDKPQPVGYNGTKYVRIDSAKRLEKQLEWNKPNYTLPIILIILVFLPILGYVALRNRT